MFEPVTATPQRQPAAPPDEAKLRSARGSAALDQWRGLALILVLISHGFFFTNRVNGAGRIGVNLFFFISGILVFRSLAKDAEGAWERTRSFWWRRLRRLYPALLAYLAVMVAAGFFLQRIPGQPQPSDFRSYIRELPWALAYLNNYHPGGPMAMGHLWSLGCEMQFYFVAPLIFILGGAVAQRRVAVFGMITAALMALGILYPLRRAHLDAAKYHFEIAVWPMMLGFFCEFAKRWFLQLPLTVVKLIFGLGWLSLAASLALMSFGMEAKVLAIGVGSVLLFPCFLGYVFGLPMPGKPGAFLRWCGERTYSVYLWQQPLTICNFLPSWLHPIGAAAALPIGALWFRWFEKPFLSANRSHRLSASEAPAP